MRKIFHILTLLIIFVSCSTAEYRIAGKIEGYSFSVEFLKAFIDEFQNFTLDDFFYNNMLEYRDSTTLFKMLQSVYEIGEKFDTRIDTRIKEYYNLAMKNILSAKINDCLSNNVKLSDMLKQVAQREFINKSATIKHDLELMTNVYVQGIREFCDRIGYPLASDKRKMEQYPL